MDVQSYRKKAAVSQAEFARQLTQSGFPCTQSLVSQWESGATKITAEWCVAFERIFPGMTRVACRPDLFGPLERANAQPGGDVQVAA